MTNIRVCIDRRDSDRKLYGMYHAMLERKENVLNEKSRHIIKSDTLVEQILIDSRNKRDFDKLLFSDAKTKELLMEIGGEHRKFWCAGRRLKIRFLNGSTFVQDKVTHYAKVWDQYANIHFDFVSRANAQIRISFDPGGSWSEVGTDALLVTDQSRPTMNFGWFDNKTPEDDFRGTTLHEFGHALGCIHEHQSPAANIDWNKPRVYEYYRTTQNPPWSKRDVDENVFEKYHHRVITNSAFDLASIMVYAIPADHTNNGFSVGWNSDLSSTDKDFIARWYPR